MEARIRDQLREAEYRALDVARRHIDAAKVLYATGAWPQACFLAMTAIEEVGKYMTIQSVRAERGDIEIEALRDAIREHRQKALMGGVPALIMNEEARRRHGRHPESGVSRIEAVRLLAMAGSEWMNLKNACLYSELDGTGGDVARGFAYLLIVGALEVYARIVSPGFRYPGVAPGHDDSDGTAARNVLVELEEFMSSARGESQVDRVDLIASPTRYAELKAAAREAVFGKRQVARQPAAGGDVPTAESVRRGGASRRGKSGRRR